MKRRTVFKTESYGARTRRLGSSMRLDNCSKASTNAPCPAKKSTKQRGSKASILGLKKAHSTSDGSTKWSGDETSAVEQVAECKRLREQLEQVLVDHQRQEKEIVALRALAKALTEEVESIQECQQMQSSACSSETPIRGRSHEFFKLDVQVEKFASENIELRRQLEESQEKRACMAEKLPVYKAAAVKANAELHCVKSQLQQEREQSDLLQKQLVRCKARQNDVSVRVSPERGNNQNERDHYLHESDTIKREREAFLRQCRRFQDNNAIISPIHRQKTPNSSDLYTPPEDQAVRRTDFASSWTSMSSNET